MTSLRITSIQANPNVQNTDTLSITIPMTNRMKVEDKPENTITSYVRSIEKLVRFHGLIHPKQLDIDEVLDFLVSLIEINRKYIKNKL
ncbi:MAG: hypothetical protein ACI9RM_001962 [Ulvibacter sp.]|jgi:hypothetical protein